MAPHRTSRSFIFLADVQGAEFIVGDAPLDLTADVPLPDDRPLDETVGIPIRQPELRDAAVDRIDEDEHVSGRRALVQADPSPPMVRRCCPSWSP